MGVTVAESMAGAGNIFLGINDIPVLLKPYLGQMTKSELHAIMTCGFATVAGTLFGAYISFGIDPGQLISASVMAAPAALAFSKLMYPETEKTRLKVEDILSEVDRGEGANVLDAAARGASVAAMIVLNIAAGLIAVLAFVEFLNQIVGKYLFIDWEDHLSGKHCIDVIRF